MARTGFDTSILHKGAHSASYFDLARSMGEGAEIVDFCIPCNPYFPTPEMFDELSRDLKNILKYYPSDSASITTKDRKSTRLNSSHANISYAVFCLKKKKTNI